MTYPLTLDANGWTVHTPSGTWQNGYNGAAPASANTSMVIYVSNSTGKNSGDGGYAAGTAGSSAAPYRTIAAALAVIRNGSPDWVLLKKGDTFTDEQLISAGTRFGKSAATEPMLFGTYTTTGVDSSHPFGTGTGARPILDLALGIKIIYAPTAVDYIAFNGIEFHNYGVDATYAAGDYSVVWFSDTHFVLFEDCKIHGFQGGLKFENNGTTARFDNVYIRRCIIAKNPGYSGMGILGISPDTYDGTTHDGIQIIECLIDANTYEPDGSPAKGAGAYGLLHNLYFGSVANIAGVPAYATGPVNLTGNIISRDSFGSHFKGGANLTNNFWARNGSGCDLGSAGPFNYRVDGDVYVEFESNTGVNGWGSMHYGLQTDDTTTVSVTGAGTACTVTFPMTHAFAAGDPFRFMAGALPPELTLSPTYPPGYYYVINPTATTLQLSATKGGSAIVTTGGTKTPTAAGQNNRGTFTVTNCLWANHQVAASVAGGFAFYIQYDVSAPVTISNNIIYKWTYRYGGTNKALDDSAITYSPNPLTLTSNQIYCGGLCVDDNVASSVFSYLDSKSLAAYAAQIGVGSTHNDLFDYIGANQRKDNWRTDLTAAAMIAYFRDTVAVTGPVVHFRLKRV